MKEADIACVLSWHMAGDMDCLITLTTKKVGSIPAHVQCSVKILYGSLLGASVFGWISILTSAGVDRLRE